MPTTQENTSGRALPEVSEIYIKLVDIPLSLLTSEAAQDLKRAVVQALVLELERRAVRVARNRGACAGERPVQALIQPGVDELGRERQVLDRSPGRPRTDLYDRQIEASRGIGRAGAQPTAVRHREQQGIAGRAERDLAVRAEERRAPGRVPVVLIVRTHVPRIALVDLGAVRATGAAVHAVQHITERHAAIADLGETTAARRIVGAAEDILGSAVGEGGFNLQAVAHAGRQVLQLESAGDRKAPGCIRLA